MSVGAKVSFLAVTVGEFVLGMLGNGLIASVSCMEWVKNGKISSADFILFNLAVARIIQLWLTLLGIFIWLSPQQFDNAKLILVFTILWTLTNHLSSWFTTCLSIFYFFKIANFSHSFFLWLKWRTKKVVLALFFGSFFILSVDLTMKGALSELWIKTYIGHASNDTLNLFPKTIYYVDCVIFSLIFIIPFLLSLISLLLLYLSLLRHIKNWQLNSLNSRDSCIEAHKRAMKMVAAFLILFVFYCTSTLLANWIFFLREKFQANMVATILSIVFLSSHSFVIIFGNKKLKQIALRLLCYLQFSGIKVKYFNS